MFKQALTLAAFTAPLFLMPGTCLAQSAETPAQQASTAVDREAPPQHDVQKPDVGLPQLLGDDVLSKARGKATIVINDQDLEGINANNVLGDYTAGAISLTDNALSNFNGVGNFVMNTGAQNNLQAGMTLTITIDN